VSQAELWDALGRWLPPHCTLVTDIGTAFWGAAGTPLPVGTAFVAQPVWSSIGYALPATLGVALAEPDRRAVLVTGDGAAQMTAAELGLLARRAPGAVVVLVDNAGYTIERALRLPDAAHHDVPRWDWTALAAALSPDRPPLTRTVRTAGELDEALKQAEAETARLTLLHVVTHPLDAPPLLRALAAAVGRPG
jgi:indolepyruvate decarboxylase